MLNYELVTSESWSDKVGSGHRVIRFRSDIPLALVLNGPGDFLVGEFSEMEGKGLGKWGDYKMGAVAYSAILRIIEV